MSRRFTNIFSKRLKGALFLYAFTITQLFAQFTPPALTITHFENTAIYAPGANISIHIYTAGNFPLNNTFQLILSDASGNFSSSSPVIGTRTDFFTPIMNGVIPATTTAGSGYKLKVTGVGSYIGAAPEVISNSFSIQPNTQAPGVVNISLVYGFSNSTAIKCFSTEQYSFGYVDRNSNAVTPSSNPWRFSIQSFNSSVNEYTGVLFSQQGLPQGSWNQINLTIDGISGISCGEFFLCDGVPEIHNIIGAFQIENVKHAMNSDGWYTILVARWRILDIK
jgi:hypothetical protein